MTNACPSCGQPLPEACGLVVDIDRNEVRFAGQSFHVTAKQMRILGALVEAKGRAVSKAVLFDACYFDNPQGDDIDWKIIDVFVCKLRAALAPLVPFGIEIKTVRGMGWEFVAPGVASKSAPPPISAGDMATLQYGGPRS